VPESLPDYRKDGKDDELIAVGSIDVEIGIRLRGAAAYGDAEAAPV
jgi:hypothetical protein